MLHPELVDLGGLIDDLLNRFEAALASKRLRVEVDVSEEAKRVSIDPRMVSEILSNLIDNAVRYTDSGGLAVQASIDAGLVLSVRDSGRGIDAIECERIFQPFEHGERIENKSTPGIGLVLTLVREFAAALGGRVTVESAKGQGSTFTVQIPSRVHVSRMNRRAVLPPCGVGRNVLAANSTEQLTRGKRGAQGHRRWFGAHHLALPREGSGLRSL
jgi:signal transduction histidine kinase